MSIHATAIVNSGAEVDPTAEIGPYCVIGPNVKIGAKTRLISHVVVDGHTTIGTDNVIHPHAVIGGTPQDFKYKGEPARVIVGNGNMIRECVTIHMGTATGHMETRLGNNCLLMAYSHIAHDGNVGNNVVMANSVGLAGHVTVRDNVIISGLAGVQQFCEIGRNAYIAGAAMVAKSVPPFCVAKGDRAKLAMINIIGVRRMGWPREKIHALRHAFQALFQSEEPLQAALAKVEAELAPKYTEIADFCQFIRAQKRGVCAGRRGLRPTEDLGTGAED